MERLPLLSDVTADTKRMCQAVKVEAGSPWHGCLPQFLFCARSVPMDIDEVQSRSKAAQLSHWKSGRCWSCVPVCRYRNEFHTSSIPQRNFITSITSIPPNKWGQKQAVQPHVTNGLSFGRASSARCRLASTASRISSAERTLASFLPHYC